MKKQFLLVATILMSLQLMAQTKPVVKSASNSNATSKSTATNWQPYSSINKSIDQLAEAFTPMNQSLGSPLFSSETDVPLFQLLNTYIVFPSSTGFMLIHQQAAQERILYEQYQLSSQEKPIATQRTLFPLSLQLNAADALLLEEINPILQQVGFQLEKEKNP